MILPTKDLREWDLESTTGKQLVIKPKKRVSEVRVIQKYHGKYMYPQWDYFSEAAFGST